MRFQKTLASIDLTPSAIEVAARSCFSLLKSAYRDQNETRDCRARYAQELSTLCADAVNGTLQGDPLTTFIKHGPFKLAYQGLDDRVLQTTFGEMLCRLMASRFLAENLSDGPSPGEPIRVGIVGGFFREHSVWKIPVKGWLTQLDRNRFHISCYHTTSHQDAETAITESVSKRFVQGPLTIGEWRREILADAPHVLIYPSLHMDRVATLLAAQRLALIQCNSWGHPVTSGMPTVDYYLSNELMEPPDAERHYTEKLIRLPNLGLYYESISAKPVPVTREQLTLRPDATVFWCGQSVIKYLPQHDDVFPRIAKQAGNCQFVFITHFDTSEPNGIFQTRLNRTFALHGLRAQDHCIALKAMNADDYAAVFGLCDVVLDSIGWSGCNSTMESLAHNLPIVTMPGEFMRGRHTAAILQMMGVTDTVASSVEDYIETAVRLATDPIERKAISDKIAANKHKLYRDRLCITAMEDFLNHVVQVQAI